MFIVLCDTRCTLKRSTSLRASPQTGVAIPWILGKLLMVEIVDIPATTLGLPHHTALHRHTGSPHQCEHWFAMTW